MSFSIGLKRFCVHDRATFRRYLFQFTDILNNLHRESRYYTNLIPNASLSVLSTLNIFTGRDNLRTYINNAYRDLFFLARGWHNQFENFVQGISVDIDALLLQHTECYRTLPRCKFAISKPNQLRN